MSFTFGFYNSLAGDRKYNSVQISRLFEGIINDGVFASIGDSLMVTDGAGGMTVNVGTGRAWFNNTWNDNDAIIPMIMDASEAVLNRIDAIVLEVQDASDVRTNSIKKIKGTPASVPVAPAMIDITGQHQYPLAFIAVNAGVTEITAANITNKVGTVDCPFATVVGLDALLPVWEDEFTTWFNALQAQMAGDVATNLQNQITANLNTEKATKTKYGTCATAAATAEKTSAIADFSLVTGVVVVINFTNLNTAANPTLNISTTGAKDIQCCGVAAVSGQIPKNAQFQYDGAAYQLLNPAYPPGVVPIANGGTGAVNLAGARSALGVPTAYNYKAYVAATADKTFVVPAGVTKIRVWACAAGGDGNGSGGGGLAGDFVAGKEYTVTPGSTLAITVGAGNTEITNVAPALSLIAASLSVSMNWNILGILTGVGSGGVYVNGGAYGGAYGYGGGAGAYDGSHGGSDGAGAGTGVFSGGAYGSGNGKIIHDLMLSIGGMDLLPLDTAGGGNGLSAGVRAGNSGLGTLGGVATASRGAGGGAGGYGAGGGSTYGGAACAGKGSPGMVIIGYKI